MPVYTGSSSLSKAYVGSVPLDGIYVGVTPIWVSGLNLKASSASSPGSSTNTFVATRPTTDVAVGDLMVMVIAQANSTNGSNVGPAGWSQINTQTIGSSLLLAFSKVVTANEPTDYTLTLNGTSSVHRATFIVFRGSVTTPTITASGGSTNNSNTTTCPSVTTTKDNAIVLWVAWGFGGATSFTWNAPATEVQPNLSLSVAMTRKETAGATGTQSVTSNVSGARAWMTIAVQPA